MSHYSLPDQASGGVQPFHPSGYDIFCVHASYGPRDLEHGWYLRRRAPCEPVGKPEGPFASFGEAIARRIALLQY